MKVTGFYDDLMPRLPGADESLVEHETYAAVRQLCEDGWAWPQDLDPLNLSADQPNIYLDPLPGDTRVGYVLLVTYQASGGARRALTPMTVAPPVDTVGSTTPRFFYLSTPGEMKLYPTPSEDQTDVLYVSCTVIPRTKNTTLPDFFSTHHRDAIIDGVCARMMLMTSKPWSNGPLALTHNRRWRNYIKRCRDITKRKYSLADGPWAFPSREGWQ